MIATKFCRLAALAACGSVLLTGCGGSHRATSAPGSSGSGSDSANRSGSTAGPSSGSRSGSSAPGSAKPGSTGARSTGPNATGSAGAEGSESPGLTDCSIATAAQVRAVFGGTVSKVTSSATGTGAPLCTFVVVRATLGKVITIGVSTHQQIEKNSFEQGKAAAIKAGAVAVAGVGDGAYYTRSAGTLQFRKGNVGGFVQGSIPLASSSAAAGLQAAAVRLANAMIDNL